MQKLAIVMPAYNEELRIGRTLEAYGSFFSKIKVQFDIDTKILVAINNTSDKTEDIVKSYSEKYNFIEYINLKRGGKGYAVIESFKQLLKEGHDFIGFADADLATSPDQFFRLYHVIRMNDGVIANRYIKGSRIIPLPTIQRLMARKIFNLLIRLVLLVPFEDTQCGAKLFTRRAIEKVLPKLGMSQWAFDVDLLYNIRKLGLKVISCPTIWSDEKYSTINFWKAGPWMAIAVIRLRIINSPFQKFIRIYDKLIGFVPK